MQGVQLRCCVTCVRVAPYGPTTRHAHNARRACYTPPPTQTHTRTHPKQSYTHNTQRPHTLPRLSRQTTLSAATMSRDGCERGRFVLLCCVVYGDRRTVERAPARSNNTQPLPPRDAPRPPASPPPLRYDARTALALFGMRSCSISCRCRPYAHPLQRNTRARTSRRTAPRPPSTYVHARTHTRSHTLKLVWSPQLEFSFFIARSVDGDHVQGCKGGSGAAAAAAHSVW